MDDTESTKLGSDLKNLKECKIFQEKTIREP